MLNLVASRVTIPKGPTSASPARNEPGGQSKRGATSSTEQRSSESIVAETPNIIERIAILEHRIADVEERIASFRRRGINADASERALQGLIAAKDAYLELAKSPAREQETQSRSQQPATSFEESKKS